VVELYCEVTIACDPKVNQLNLMAYLSDVKPRCGGTTVSPHHRRRKQHTVRGSAMERPSS
jgi:hypothetical protein